MSCRHEITDEPWLRIRDFLPGGPFSPGVTVDEATNRRFINAIFYVAKTGIPWRDLPERFGKWNSVFQRFNRWSQKGIWQRIFEAVQDPDLEWLMLDSTFVKGHQHAAGAAKTNQEQEDPTQAIGKSRGGKTTKIHVAIDALGNPVRILLSGGNRNDCTFALPLLQDHEGSIDCVIADKAYDSNAIRQTIEVDLDAEAVIPATAQRRDPPEHDEVLYKERNLVERFFNKIKHYRRVATRYEKTARNFLAFVQFASIMLWLR